MYPQINQSTPSKEVVALLVAQVKELIEGNRMSRESAISTVVNNRYNGRFRHYMGNVRRALVLTEKKPATAPSQGPIAYLSGQYASLAMDAKS